MELPYSANLVLLITSISFLTSCPTIRALQGNETDKLALLAFKYGISDPLFSLRSWNSTIHFCQWEGVVCSRRDQRVVTLNLQEKGLVGTISPHIGNLSLLTELRLGNNSLVGVIPQEFGRLSRLQYLDLQNNTIGGRIPGNLSHCSELELLDLSMNQLVGNIPAELSSLSNLSALFLPQNNLSGSIPPALGNLSSLAALSLMRNNLEGSIPDDLSRLARLGFFQVTGNHLSGPIPPSLYNLSSIYYLAAADNRLGGSLPPNLGLTLPKLEGLFLPMNQFTGPIPISLVNASGLTEVDLSSNNLIGPIPENLGVLGGLTLLNFGPNQLGSRRGNDLNFITSLTNCTGLQTLSVQDNLLRGPIPSSTANLSIQLDSLVLRGNMIYGTIPMGLENLVNLTLLSLGINLLVGTIPSNIGNLRKLQVLSFRENRLSGNIPTSLGNLSSLIQLLLQKNSLEGDIPSSLGECRSLLFLDLSQNNLEGKIPPQLLGLQFLSISLDLSHNSLSGPLPVEVGSLQSLGELIVSHNKLTGTIPTTLGGCVSLERLFMNNNSFEGGIPSSLSNMKGLQELDLSHNNLTGQIPSFLGSFLYLKRLNLSYNDLSGQVPKDGIFTNTSAISLLGNGRLCGGSPSSGLPACPTQASNNGGRKTSHHVKLAILVPCLVLSSIALAGLFFVFWMRKEPKRQQPSPESCEEDQYYRRVSYSELFRGTDGFSSSNLIGAGSYGTIYRAQLDRDQAVVAVKVLNLQQREASKSFLAECRALRSVRHRNLVKIITVCSSLDHKGNDFKALVFEFMGNGSLDQWLHPKDETAQRMAKGSLGFLQRLNIAIDVASALDYLHHHGPTPIVHCDLKPSNILLNDDMTACVGDFGLARFLSLASSTTETSTAQNSTMGIVGTIGYIPAEYGMSGKATTEGDVYSYGILLLEMFTGKRPTDRIFEGNLNIRKLVESAYPRQVTDVVDPSLMLMLAGDGDHVWGTDIDQRNELRRVAEDCLVSVLGVGLSCCVELPQERPDMGETIVQLQGVRDAFLKNTKGRGMIYSDSAAGSDEAFLHATGDKETGGTRRSP